MRFSPFAAVLALAVPVFSYSTTYHLSTNNLYDKGDTKLNDVACSNGEFGLLTKGLGTFDSIPNYPNIAASSVINGWNSPLCGSCWELKYSPQKDVFFSVNVTLINNVEGAKDSFSISEEAFAHLTHGHGDPTKIYTIDATRVSATGCGF